jgi:hypothetical protein
LALVGWHRSPLEDIFVGSWQWADAKDEKGLETENTLDMEQREAAFVSLATSPDVLEG